MKTKDVIGVSFVILLFLAILGGGIYLTVRAFQKDPDLDPRKDGYRRQASAMFGGLLLGAFLLAAIKIYQGVKE